MPCEDVCVVDLHVYFKLVRNALTCVGVHNHEETEQMHSFTST